MFSNLLISKSKLFLTGKEQKLNKTLLFISFLFDLFFVKKVVYLFPVPKRKLTCATYSF